MHVHYIQSVVRKGFKQILRFFWQGSAVSKNICAATPHSAQPLTIHDLGLDLGILSPTLFTMFVLMALATTLATTPILQALSRHGSPATTT